MIAVQFPEPKFRIEKRGDEAYIFDALRKTWLRLTEEEWVRQNFVAWLVKVQKHEAALIALEKEIQVGERTKRFDILVYNIDHQPLMLVECKAPGVPLNEEVLQQVLRYHSAVPVKFIIITNGRTTIGWEKEGTGLRLLNEMPRLG